MYARMFTHKIIHPKVLTPLLIMSNMVAQTMLEIALSPECRKTHREKDETNENRIRSSQFYF